MSNFKLNKKLGYFQNTGVDVMAFDDIYPEGHQSGISIIMHGNRIGTNGDLRFEQTPGQWQPVPKQGERIMDEDLNTIKTSLNFPDREKHLKGFNPMIYPDFEFNYEVVLEGKEDHLIIKVHLDRPVPEKYLGKLSFNMELFPGALMGKPWIMDNNHGIFPDQPNGPVKSQPSNLEHTGDFALEDAYANEADLCMHGKEYSPMVADDLIGEPYAVGRRFTIRPEDPYNRLTIECKENDLMLYDGRMNHNNGWFVISSEVPADSTENALEWIIRPNVVEDWQYKPVVQTSQVGYHIDQSKRAIIELDRRTEEVYEAELYKISEEGPVKVLTNEGDRWGQFLRYNYLTFDFTDIKEEGLYQVKYGDSESNIFKISKDVYDRGVWQPVLEYFLPVQMCHMRVNEKYRVWHGLCHDDDARMAPISYNHIDGYIQGPSTLTKYKPGDSVPGLNKGGWHDAGDYDLRVESQAGEAYILSLAYEEFDVDYDSTTIDQEKKIAEIHQPDGKNDILQQIEHGLLSVVGAYESLGRLYRGIIENNLRQYVLLGDTAAVTDNIMGNDDDRWVFTEDNPPRELRTAAQLAASARALKDFNPDLSKKALKAAEELFEVTRVNDDSREAKIHAAVEIYLTTEDDKYKEFLLSELDFIVENIERTGWYTARAEKLMADEGFSKAYREALKDLKKELDKQSAETPYGIPYRPHIWGAGWDIQRRGYEYYFLHRAYPEIFDPEMLFNALNFILGCHPGSNTMSFASGIGSLSAKVGYGLNRADWSFIPGGVISGTALIRPDFPELLVFPYLWQQVEYVMGGGSSHFMFIALAAQNLLNK